MKLKDNKWIGQFIKFGLVGVSNTLISYGIDMLGYYVVFKNTAFSGIIDSLNTIGIKATSDSVKVVIVTAIAFFCQRIKLLFLEQPLCFYKRGKEDSRATSDSVFADDRQLCADRIGSNPDSKAPVNQYYRHGILAGEHHYTGDYGPA